jgi:hypothetical protein
MYGLAQIWARMVEAGMMSVLARLRGREVTVDEVLAVHSQSYAQLMTSVLDAKETEKVWCGDTAPRQTREWLLF